MTRPGAALITTTRSESSTASRIECVTKSTDMRSRSQMRSNSRRSSSLDSSSSGAERLVHEQQSRPVCERSRERDTLAHAARQLSWVVRREALHADAPQ